MGLNRMVTCWGSVIVGPLGTLAVFTPLTIGSAIRSVRVVDAGLLFHEAVPRTVPVHRIRHDLICAKLFFARFASLQSISSLAITCTAFLVEWTICAAPLGTVHNGLHRYCFTGLEAALRPVRMERETISPPKPHPIVIRGTVEVVEV